MILDDYSRMIVGGRLFYQENAYNFQKVLKDAVAAYGIPNKLYVDSGAPYKNRQLDMICASIGTVLLHTPVRDGASKGKVERNFRTLKERWLYGLDLKQIQSLDEFMNFSQHIFGNITQPYILLQEKLLFRVISTVCIRSGSQNPQNGWMNAF